jgi:hypothetical protein
LVDGAGRAQVQREAVETGYGDIVEAARLGVRGAGAALPHRDRIQRSFGRHDVSGIVAHTDQAAIEGARAMGAAAFTMGNHVAFAGSASLRIASHEAAHAVQQRGNLMLAGGVGRVGDVHERHADEVAARVEAGRSSEDLLDRYAAPVGAKAGGKEDGAAPVTQRQCAECGDAGSPCAACAASSERGPAGSVVQHKREPDEGKKTGAAAQPRCEQGCAQRWGQDTTCSKWGFRVGELEHAPQVVVDTAKAKNPKSVKELLVPCCNSWPFAVEDHARRLGLNGAASCPPQHERKIATVGFNGKQVQVLCSDTIPSAMAGPTNDPKDCTGKVALEMLEMSPKAMQDLSGQLGNALHVSVCFSGAKQDMCLHDGPGKASFPEAENCLTRGCSVDPGTPKLKDTGWPRS